MKISGLTLEATLHHPSPPQVVVTENKLIKSVKKLQSKNRVFRELPTTGELTNSEYEHKVTKESPYAFPGGDLEIVEQIRYEKKVQCGEIIEVDDEDEEEVDTKGPDANLTRHDAILLISQLEYLSIRLGGGEVNTSRLAQELCQFRAHLFREELLNSKQTSIDSYFSRT